MRKKSILMGEPQDEVVASPATEWTVSIQRSEFEAMMSRMNRLEEKNKNNSEVLSTDTGFKKYHGPRAYSFKSIDGKPITHLRLTSNIVKKNLSTGGWVEDQRIMVSYADDTEEEMTYDDFVQSYIPSDKFTPIREDHKVKIYFNDKFRKPEVVSDGEYKTIYCTYNETGILVTNHSTVKKAEMLDYITFKIDEQDEEGNFTVFGGKEFTVDHTAIN